MIKTVNFEFPNDFQFPEFHRQKSATRSTWLRGVERYSPCEECVLNYNHFDIWERCTATGETEAECPFYNGSNSAGPVSGLDDM